MKAINIVLASLVLSVALCSCSNNKNDTPTTTGKVQSTATNIPEANTKGNTPSDKTQNNDSSSNDQYSKIGFDLMKNDSLGSLKLNIGSDDVLKALGEPDEKSEALVWGSDGLEHQPWIYTSKGIMLDIVKKEDVCTVNSIDISNPCTFKTSRGIGLGSKRSDVLEIYKAEIDPDGNKENTDFIVAGSVYGGIIFSFENDSVSEIFIGASAE